MIVMGLDMQVLRGFSAIDAWRRYLADPLLESERLFRTYGPLVQIGPFVSDRERPAFHAVGPELARQVLGNPEGFRAGGLLIKGPPGSALNRLRKSYFSANGAEHAHYRNAFKPFFRKEAVRRSFAAITSIAETEISSWPRRTPLDVVPLAERLTQQFAIRTFFGDRDDTVALQTAREVSALGRLGALSWRNATAMPLPGSTYKRMLEQANATEAALMRWAQSRHGCPAHQDILAAMVNGKNETGGEPCPMQRLGYVWNMFGAAYDLSLIHISEPTRRNQSSRMPSSA